MAGATSGGGRIGRRSFLLGSAASAAWATASWGSPLWTPGGSRAAAEALRRSLAVAADPTGTTLASSILPTGGPGFRGLVEGPGWPTLVRQELAAAAFGREDRRRPLASIVQLTDVHIVDVQSPGRVEFVDLFGDPFTAAFRPHEALSCHVQAAMVERINAIGRGPVTGRPFDCAVSTGDNIDNQQANELAWFIGILDGGTITPDSGAIGTYEGVQDAAWADPRYWHPEPGTGDVFKTDHAFPDMPGLLDAAVAPFTTPGLGIPWYTTYGNHDGLVQGNLPTAPPLDEIMTGNRKITDLQPGQSVSDFLAAMFTDSARVRDDLAAGLYPHRVVTGDAGRRTVGTRDWVQAHLDATDGPGPIGHGYTEDHLELPALYYRFEIAPGVTGISLDTGGFNSGTIGQHQVDWLEMTLRSLHSTWYDTDGSVRTGSGDDRLVVLLSHFNMASMQQSLPDPEHPDERRYTGDELRMLIHRYPNVIAWVNGHHHVNAVRPIPDPSGRTQGFWDINTASHIDWPEHARIIELVDNADGTLSIFCTMIEHAAPIDAADDDWSVLGLAARSRELSVNDPQSDLVGRLGSTGDLNVELLIAAPHPPVPGAAAVAEVTPQFTG